MTLRLTIALGTAALGFLALINEWRAALKAGPRLKNR